MEVGNEVFERRSLQSGAVRKTSEESRRSVGRNTGKVLNLHLVLPFEGRMLPAAIKLELLRHPIRNTHKAEMIEYKARF